MKSFIAYICLFAVFYFGTLHTSVMAFSMNHNSHSSKNITRDMSQYLPDCQNVGSNYHHNSGDTKENNSMQCCYAPFEYAAIIKQQGADENQKDVYTSSDIFHDVYVFGEEDYCKKYQANISPPAGEVYFQIPRSDYGSLVGIIKNNR